MKSLTELQLEQSIKTVYEYYWKTHDYETWVNETYEDYCLNNNQDITENEFYHDKYINFQTTWDIPHYAIWQSIIYERLGESFKLTDKNINSIKGFSGVLSLRIINNKNYKFLIEVDNSFSEADFTSLMNFYNYAKDLDKINRNGNRELTYEAVTPKEIKYNDDFVYHVTHSSAYEKIMKYGLIPKNPSRHEKNKIDIEYPSRIYCFSKDTPMDILTAFGQLNNSVHNRDLDDIIILKVNIVDKNSSLDNNHKIKFFGDPSYNINNAMFTLEPIETKYIETVDTVNEAINNKLDDQWINDNKPVCTQDGRQAIIKSIDMKVVPNIIHGKVKMKEKLFDFEWQNNGKCVKAVDVLGNPTRPSTSDNLVKFLG